MAGFVLLLMTIISVSITLLLFFITSILFLVKQRQNKTQNVSHIIRDGGPPVLVSSATHTPHGGGPIPGQNGQVMVQMPIQGMQTSPGMQQHIYAHQAAMSPPINYNATTSSPELNENSGSGQTHVGAVEALSQI